jgi:hypothetical protein
MAGAAAKKKKVLTLALALWSFMLFSQKITHTKFTELLKLHVDEKGQVDYDGFLKDRTKLKNYLKDLAQVEHQDNWTKNDSVSYFINLYNAATIDLILQYYPVKSIKDIPKPWAQKRVSVGKDSLSLNHIEHTILRKMGEPKIHFALNCASKSCPKLQRQAYESPTLNVQLDQATLAFLTNESLNQIASETYKISKLFKWYKSDFDVEGGVVSFIQNTLKVELNTKIKVDYISYDWSLNAK